MTQDDSPQTSAPLNRLDPIIGKWITQGQTVASAGVPSMAIVASDTYEWAANGQHVLYKAYSFAGDTPGGGVEMISADPSTGECKTLFFDSLGDVSRQTLTISGDSWTWEGDHMRCFGEFSDGGKTMTAKHEASEDGTTWLPSMNVVLRRAE